MTTTNVRSTYEPLGGMRLPDRTEDGWQQDWNSDSDDDEAATREAVRGTTDETAEHGSHDGTELLSSANGPLPSARATALLQDLPFTVPFQQRYAYFISKLRSIAPLPTVDVDVRRDAPTASVTSLPSVWRERERERAGEGKKREERDR